MVTANLRFASEGIFDFRLNDYPSLGQPFSAFNRVARLSMSGGFRGFPYSAPMLNSSPEGYIESRVGAGAGTFVTSSLFDRSLARAQNVAAGAASDPPSDAIKRVFGLLPVEQTRGFR
jgi:hypothetical protein